jgi:hypothetical protein
MNTCLLVKRGNMYDVYINNKLVGKGQAAYIHTAYVFYSQEGFDVEVVYGDSSEI